MKKANNAGTEIEIRINGHALLLSRRTHLMGVLNRTPDSFSDGGAFVNEDMAFHRAVHMAQDGADIIDIGGESTRPGAEPVAPEEEIARTCPLIQRLARHTRVPISIDTRKAVVAQRALEAGASLINDVSGLRGDPDMARCAAHAGVPVVIMHMQGTPATMQTAPSYTNLREEIISFFKDSMRIARKAGIREHNIILDPGIGFGKTVRHNYEILCGLHRFAALGRPLLVGVSRKSFITRVLEHEGIPPSYAHAEGRLHGTAAAAALAICAGAHIIRVHDVKEMKCVAHVSDAFNAARTGEIPHEYAGSGK